LLRRPGCCMPSPVRPGRGRGAVQDLAREHTSTVAAGQRWPPRLACQALPGPTTSTFFNQLWAAGKEPAADARANSMAAMGCWLPAAHQRWIARSRLWGRAGPGTRGAAASLGMRQPLTCVRVPGPERPRGLGLAATVTASRPNQQAVKRRQALTAAAAATPWPGRPPPGTPCPPAPAGWAHRPRTPSPAAAPTAGPRSGTAPPPTARHGGWRR